MSLKVRIRHKPGGPGAGYRVQPSSFGLSILFHAAVVTGLLLLPPGASEQQDRKRPIYEELIQPEAKKIVWFPVPKPKPLPEVSAEQRIGTFPKPRAPQKAETAIIATAPKPKSVKQFIWQAVPKIEIHQDLPAPNLIARAAMAIPAPPPLPKGDVNKAQPIQTQPVEVPKPTKAFVPPPPSRQPPKLAIPVQTADVPLPDASLTATPMARAALPEGIGAPSFSKGAPPPLNAPPGPVNAAGNGKVDIAVVGL